MQEGDFLQVCLNLQEEERKEERKHLIDLFVCCCLSPLSPLSSLHFTSGTETISDEREVLLQDRRLGVIQILHLVLDLYHIYLQSSTLHCLFPSSLKIFI